MFTFPGIVNSHFVAYIKDVYEYRSVLLESVKEQKDKIGKSKKKKQEQEEKVPMSARIEHRHDEYLYDQDMDAPPILLYCPPLILCPRSRQKQFFPNLACYNFCLRATDLQIEKNF